MAEALPEHHDSDFSEDDLSPLDVSFNEATTHVRKITDSLDNHNLLDLYALFKQSTEGKCEIPKPSWYDRHGKMKWEAWKKLRNMSKENAKKKYISLVQEFDSEWTAQTSKKDTWVAVSSLQYTPEPELAVNELSLLDAARDNCAEHVKQLLQANPELCNDKDEDGLTALHWATDRNSTEALIAALEGGCPVNAVDSTGQTALHYAAACGHVESSKILVLAGALLTKDEDGQTPLDLADDDEIRKILEGLLEVD